MVYGCLGGGPWFNSCMLHFSFIFSNPLAGEGIFEAWAGAPAYDLKSEWDNATQSKKAELAKEWYGVNMGKSFSGVGKIVGSASPWYHSFAEKLE